MTTIEQVLHTYAQDLAVDDFAAELDRALSRAGRPDPTALSSHDREILVGVGVTETDLDADVGNTLIHARADNLIRFARDSETVQQVAARLHRSEQRIRGAIADGSLYGIKQGRNWRLPRWQFADERPLPQLRRVIAGIPSDTSAIAIGNLMTTPSRELFLDDRPTAPREWLLAGGESAPVVSLIAGLDRW